MDKWRRMRRKMEKTMYIFGLRMSSLDDKLNYGTTSANACNFNCVNISNCQLLKTTNYTSANWRRIHGRCDRCLKTRTGITLIFVAWDTKISVDFYFGPSYLKQYKFFALQFSALLVYLKFSDGFLGDRLAVDWQKECFNSSYSFNFSR
jgi:hypothetical protein